MIAALATLLGSQLAGEALVRLASLPIPGPVVGMILLFVLMLMRTRCRRRLVKPPTACFGTYHCCSFRRVQAWFSTWIDSAPMQCGLLPLSC